MAEDNGTPVLYRYRFSCVEFDESSMTLVVDGEPVPVEKKPLELLRLLLANADEVMTKEEIFDVVWDGKVTVENVLANAVSKLRTALGPETAPRLITQKRIGYRFQGPVERVAVGRALSSNFSFTEGEKVPSRPNFVLHQMLASSSGREIWRARHVKSGETRIYKFASDASGLDALKREVTIARLLKESPQTSRYGASVLDWNFETPEFFIEFADNGEDLSKWAARDDNLKNLPIDKRVKLAASIVEAVARAHSAGVLHKDLKPPNILVRELEDNSVGVTLIDFGSAAIFDRERVEALNITPLGFTQDTQSESFRSTAIYAAPEMLNGQPASIRSDVYALGVILYQILAGDLQTPLTTNWEDNVSDPLLREDIAEATRSDPARRLASADMLLERLHQLGRRHETVRMQAAREAEIGHVRRKAKRMRVRLFISIAALITLALVTTISTTFSIQVNAARRESDKQAQIARASSDFLKEVLNTADPRASNVTANSTINDAVERASIIVDENFSDNVETHEAVLATLADVYGGLSEFGRQAKTLEKLYDLRSQLHGVNDPLSVITAYKRAHAMVRSGDLERADSFLQRLNEAQINLGLQNAEAEMLRLTVNGQFYLSRFEFKKSAEYNEKAETHYHASSLDQLNLLLEARLQLAQAYSRLERYDDAVEVFSSLAKPPYTESSDIPEYRIMRVRQLYGAALVFASRYSEAADALRNSIEELSAVYGDESALVAETRAHLGSALASQGRYGEAAIEISKGRKISCAILGEEHMACLGAMANEGNMMIQAAKYEAALEVLAPVREAFASLAGETSAPVQWIDYQRADAFLELRSTEEASSILPTLMVEKLNEASPGELWEVRMQALEARYLIQSGHEDEGRAMLTEAIDRMKEEDFPDTLIARTQNALN